MSDLFDYSGRTVFVAGGTSGINLGVARAFAGAGASVGVLSRSPDKVRAAVDSIGVNAVVPGPIEDTEGMARLAPTPEMADLVTRSVPMGRYGTAQEIADCCLWLASPYAAYVNGAIIPVDGGWSLGGASEVFTAMRNMLAG
ncbi:SDR family oxidoreductase [Nocardia sp. NPDC059764]|uniref:SDR family oxidoreductase n=1 Tax=Nocardia sp. NPDC059764 TaxID=3346939 RepID=UPI00364D3356